MPKLGLPEVDWSRYHLQVSRDGRWTSTPRSGRYALLGLGSGGPPPGGAARAAPAAAEARERRAHTRRRCQPHRPQVLFIDTNDVLRARLAAALFERVAEWNGEGAGGGLHVQAQRRPPPGRVRAQRRAPRSAASAAHQ